MISLIKLFKSSRKFLYNKLIVLYQIEKTFPFYKPLKKKREIITINTFPSFFSSMTTHRKLSASKINGRWTSEEHRLFIEGLAKYGKDWKKIEDHIKSRDGAQIRSHAQKFFLRMTKEYKRMLKTGKYSDKLPSFSFDSQES